MMMHPQRGVRIDTMELKADIIRMIGLQKAERYFDQLGRLLSLKVSKNDFSRFCGRIFGKENLHLHNRFIKAILMNANVAKILPLKCRNDRFGNGVRRNVLGLVNVTGDYVGKEKEHQSATELFSIGSKPPVEVASVEEGEEVEQIADSPCIQSKSPVTAPLGVSAGVFEARKVRLIGSNENCQHETCQISGQLPDTMSLKKQLARLLEMEDVDTSTDCVNLLNSSLDVYIKRLIEPCLEIATSRAAKHNIKQREHELYGSSPDVQGGNWQPSTKSVFASLTDFRTSLEMNPHVLGGEWALQLEKISARVSDMLGYMITENR